MFVSGLASPRCTIVLAHLGTIVPAGSMLGAMSDTPPSRAEELLQEVIDFVEGRLSPPDFLARLYAEPAFEQLLDDSSRPPPEYVQRVTMSTYHYVLELNASDTADVLDKRGALVDLLHSRGVTAVPDASAAMRFELLLKAQPGWLDVPTGWLEREVLPHSGGLEQRPADVAQEGTARPVSMREATASVDSVAGLADPREPASGLRGTSAHRRPVPRRGRVLRRSDRPLRDGGAGGVGTVRLAHRAHLSTTACDD